VIKVRCDIVDGSRVGKRSTKRKQGDENSNDGEEKNSVKEDDARSGTKAHPVGGPIFTIRWGVGIDQSLDA